MPESNEKISILYMEDDKGLARLVQKRLGRLGFQVDLAENGVEGLTLLCDHGYHLILADYNMPECGGIEVLLRMAELQNSTPVVMLTGNGNEKVAVSAMKHGATDYIVKDVDLNYLELLPIVIGQVLHKQQLLREREQMLAQLQESEERYRKLVELSPDGIAIHQNGVLKFINSAGKAILGAASDVELNHRNLRDFFPGELCAVTPDSSHASQFGEDRGSDLPWVETRLLRLDLSSIDVELKSIPFHHEGELLVQTIFRDISERNLARQRLEYMAHYDLLTRLPNRALFFNRLEHQLNFAKRKQEVFALMFLDLDRFKQVNDTFGHDIGDLLLQEAARRLSHSLRKSDCSARLGGDEFSVILAKINEPEEAGLVAQKIMSSLSEPFHLQGVVCTIGVSIGISVFPLDGSDSGTLLKKADSAMYQAKKGGRNRFCFSSDNEDE